VGVRGTVSSCPSFMMMYHHVLFPMRHRTDDVSSVS
jgi:hypothetical protein